MQNLFTEITMAIVLRLGYYIPHLLFTYSEIYMVVMDLLKKRFGDKLSIVSHNMAKIIKLPNVTNLNETIGMCVL